MPSPLVPIRLSIRLARSCPRKLYTAATARQRHATTEGRQASQQKDSFSQSTEERQAFSRKIENPHVYKNGPKLSVRQVMVGEKRRDFPPQQLWLASSGSWCPICLPSPDSRGLSPSLLWLAAGVVSSAPSRRGRGMAGRAQLRGGVWRERRASTNGNRSWDSRSLIQKHTTKGTFIKWQCFF